MEENEQTQDMDIISVVMNKNILPWNLNMSLLERVLTTMFLQLMAQKDQQLLTKPKVNKQGL